MHLDSANENLKTFQRPRTYTTALKDYFRREGEAGLVTGDWLTRVGAGRKRLRVHGALVYNECRSTFAGGLP